MSHRSIRERPVTDATLSSLLEEGSSWLSGLVDLPPNSVPSLHHTPSDITWTLGFHYVDLDGKTNIEFVADDKSSQTDVQVNANMYKLQLLSFAKMDKKATELIEQNKEVQINIQLQL